jgi:hypothetical protein
VGKAFHGVPGAHGWTATRCGRWLHDIGYFSKMQNAKLKWPTTNGTTPYALGYWNVEKEPVVVEIPPATPDIIIFGTLFDAWQRPIIDVGSD